MGKIADAHPRPPRGLSKVAVHIAGSGFYEAPGELIDRAMAKYLPASREEIQAVIDDRCGPDEAPQVDSVAEGLVVLASFEPDNPY